MSCYMPSVPYCAMEHLLSAHIHTHPSAFLTWGQGGARDFRLRFSVTFCLQKPLLQFGSTFWSFRLCYTVTIRFVLAQMWDVKITSTSCWENFEKLCVIDLIWSFCGRLQILISSLLVKIRASETILDLMESFIQFYIYTQLYQKINKSGILKNKKLTLNKRWTCWCITFTTWLHVLLKP